MPAMSNALAAQLAALTALDEGGSPVALGPLWARQPAVVGFVRHFG
jgi:hypothetical protein